MLVSIGKKTWEMSRKEYEKLLEVAREQVPFGIYAVEKGKHESIEAAYKRLQSTRV